MILPIEVLLQSSEGHAVWSSSQKRNIPTNKLYLKHTSSSLSWKKKWVTGCTYETCSCFWKETPRLHHLFTVNKYSICATNTLNVQWLYHTSWKRSLLNIRWPCCLVLGFINFLFPLNSMWPLMLVYINYTLADMAIWKESETWWSSRRSWNWQEIGREVSDIPSGIFMVTWCQHWCNMSFIYHKLYKHMYTKIKFNSNVTLPTVPIPNWRNIHHQKHHWGQAQGRKLHWALKSHNGSIHK